MFGWTLMLTEFWGVMLVWYVCVCVGGGGGGGQGFGYIFDVES